MNIKSVQIKGLHNVSDKTYDLSDTATYFYGRNGAGKSTVMQAIQLALLGYIPGYNKTKEGIFSHANDNEMSVILTFDSGEEIQRSWKRCGTRIETNVSGPDGIDLLRDLNLPILNFSEFTNMTANKLKDWFINFLPNMNVQLDWHSRLTNAVPNGISTPDIQNFISETVSYAESQSGDALEQVRNLNSYFKEQQSFKKSELSRVQSTIQSLVLYSDCDSDTSIEDLKNRNVALESERQALIQKAAKIRSDVESNKRILDQLQVVENSLSKYRVKYTTMDQLNSDIEELNATISQLNSDAEDLNSQIHDVQLKIRDIKNIVDSKGICPFINYICDTITNSMDEYHDMLNMYSCELELLTGDYKEITNRIASHKKDMDLMLSSRSSWEYSITVSNNLKNTLVVCEDISKASEMDAQIQFIMTEIADNQDRITKILANRKYDEMCDKITAEKYLIDQEIDILKSWVKLTDVNGMQSELTTAPFQDMSNTMDEFLSGLSHDDTSKPVFHVEEKANSFSFGLIRNNVYIPYDLLSSGEKCLYTFAMLLSMISCSNIELPILMSDDILDHLDDEKAKYAFEYLSNQKICQVILAGVKPCINNACEVITIQ